MTGIAGWIGDSSPHLLHGTASLLTRFDKSDHENASGNRAAVVVAGPPGLRSIAKEGEWIAAAWGRLKFDDPILVETAQARSPAAAVLHGYRTRGSGLLAVVHGAAAIAIANGTTGEMLVATDRASARPIYYAPLHCGVAFASRSDALMLHAELSGNIDHQAIYNYMHFHMVPGPSTICTEVRRLLPGEMVEYRDGMLNVNRYWRMSFSEEIARPRAELRTEFIAALESGVRNALHTEAVGCFLSGGTDSSTVSGMVNRVTGKQTSTFSIGFDEPGYDEMAFARIAANHFGTDHHEYYVTPDDIVTAIPKLAEIHDQPFGNSSAVPVYFCARMAKEQGVTTMLAGDGGDELFGGNERYAAQALFSLYEYLPKVVRSHLLEPFARSLSSEITPARWYKRFVEIAATPMPGRLDTHNLLMRIGPETILTAEFLAEVDRSRPAKIMYSAYFDTNADSLINRMLALDYKLTLADNDLPKVSRSCELAGVDVAFPLLDDDIIAFAAQLPPRLKLKGTKLRFFFKEALRGFLPNEIIRKKKHGFGLPFGQWLRRCKPLRALVFEHLSELKQRRIVNPQFIDQLLTRHLDEHAGYYGTMVWVLLMLERWLLVHDSMRRSPLRREAANG